jgi:hypothetical protein
MQSLHKIINSFDFKYLKLQGVISHTVAGLFLFMTQEQIDEYSSDLVNALTIMQYKIIGDDDIRYKYLYDSWTILLKILPPVADMVRTSVSKLITYGFEHIDRLKNLPDPKPFESLIEQAQPLCSYKRMVQSINLVCSFGRLRSD